MSRATTLGRYLHPVMNVHGQNDQNALFQQDSASIIQQNLPRTSLDNFIYVLDWAARSPTSIL